MIAAGLLPACASEQPRAPLPPTVPTLRVVMQEYRYELPPMASSGRLIVRAHNAGTVNHGINVIPLPDDLTGTIDELLQSGDRLVAPTIAILFPRDPGGDGVFALDLAPGRYAFLCFIEDPDGVQHINKGMSSMVKVR